MEEDSLREYARRWKEAAPVLEALRERDIRATNTVEAIQMFAEAYRIALRDLPMRESSGLVEWQKAMMRLRDRG